jgi:hypothetical protein
MGLTFVQGQTVLAGTGTSSGPTAYNTNTTGSSWLLVMGFVLTTSAVTLSITDSLGNTWNQIGSNIVFQTNTIGIFEVPANNVSGGANTVTLHSSVSAQLALAMAEYTGQTLSGEPVDVFTSSTWASTAASFGITGNFTNESLIALAWDSSTGAITGADGTVRLNGAGSATSVLEDRSISSPTGCTASWTNPSGGGRGMAMLVKSTTSASPYYSSTDSRVTPNTSRNVEQTLTYDVQVSSNSSIPGTDSRTSVPTDSRASIPTNSRTPGVFGPGE